jgi:hypothetical protein
MTASFSWGQLSDDYLLWSASRKLTAEDFTIKPKKPEIASSFGQFSMSYEINGFDFCWYLIEVINWLVDRKVISFSVRPCALGIRVRSSAINPYTTLFVCHPDEGGI